MLMKTLIAFAGLTGSAALSTTIKPKGVRDGSTKRCNMALKAFMMGAMAGGVNAFGEMDDLNHISACYDTCRANEVDETFGACIEENKRWFRIPHTTQYVNACVECDFVGEDEDDFGEDDCREAYMFCGPPFISGPDSACDEGCVECIGDGSAFA